MKTVIMRKENSYIVVYEDGKVVECANIDEAIKLKEKALKCKKNKQEKN